MSYALRLLPRAEKDLASLLLRTTQPSKSKIASLGENPRPHGCKERKNREGWRLRVGDCRVVYEIDDAAKAVTVLKNRHRSEVYRIRLTASFLALYFGGETTAVELEGNAVTDGHLL